MTINTATATLKDLEEASMMELLSTYNKTTGENVKKFADHKTAVRRTWKVIQQLGPGENVNAEIIEAPLAKESKRASFESRVIQLLVKENPKSPDSRAHKKFAVLMECDGKTVGEYKAKEGKYPTLDGEKGWPSCELRWAVKLNLIKINK